jgi:hypothetical protein
VTATAVPANDTTIKEPVGFDARMRRVLELREMVRQGRYVVDPGEVAAAILAEWFVAQSGVEPPGPPANALSRFLVPPTPPTPRTGEMTGVRTA